jgi:hypothetical protein
VFFDGQKLICGRVNYGGNRGQRFAFEKLSIAMEPAE